MFCRELIAFRGSLRNGLCDLISLKLSISHNVHKLIPPKSLYYTLIRLAPCGQKTQKTDNQELDRHASGPQKTRLVHTAKHGVVSTAVIKRSSKDRTQGVYRIAEKCVLNRAEEQSRRGAKNTKSS
jgi:hypothetical protein